MSNWKEINKKYVYPAIDLINKNQFDEAETIFKEGLTKTGDPYIALNYGLMLELQKRYKKARKQFEYALNKLPL
ncbi:MAG: tetratricopeptide repeat protein [Candidatus Helarchaeota archaeon]